MAERPKSSLSIYDTELAALRAAQELLIERVAARPLNYPEAFRGGNISLSKAAAYFAEHWAMETLRKRLHGTRRRKRPVAAPTMPQEGEPFRYQG